jgi:hypothetical protein
MVACAAGRFNVTSPSPWPTEVKAKPLVNKEMLTSDILTIFFILFPHSPFYQTASLCIIGHKSQVFLIILYELKCT